METPSLAWQCPMCNLVNAQERIYCVRCTMPNPFRTSVVGANGKAYPVLRRAAQYKAQRDAKRRGGWDAGMRVGRRGKTRQELREEP